MDAHAGPWKPRRSLRSRLSAFLDGRQQERVEWRAFSEILAKPHDRWLDDIGLRREDIRPEWHPTRIAVTRAWIIAANLR